MALKRVVESHTSGLRRFMPSFLKEGFEINSIRPRKKPRIVLERYGSVDGGQGAVDERKKDKASLP
jgi:hypothetical protein